MAKNNYNYGLGRRKRATATARLFSGKGKITINDKPAEEYFSKNERMIWEISQPLVLVDLAGKYDVSILVSGGGLSGQVDACKLAITKAIAELNEDFRGTLKKAGFLKRDSREKERKKYGLKRARKQEQFSKR